MASNTERRDSVLVAAGELFATKGVAGTTVREIGEACSMLAGSLYHHFRSKDAIVAEIMQRYLEAIRTRVSQASTAAPDPVSAIRRLVSETLHLIDEYPHATSIYQNDQQYLREHGLLEHLDEVSEQVRAMWMDAIETGVAQGSIRGDVPPTVIYQTMRETMWSSPHWQARGDFETDTLAELLCTLFLRGSLAERA